MKPDVGQIWLLKKPKVYYCLTEKIKETNTENIWRGTPVGFGDNMFLNLFDKSQWEFIC